MLKFDILMNHTKLLLSKFFDLKVNPFSDAFRVPPEPWESKDNLERILSPLQHA